MVYQFLSFIIFITIKVNIVEGILRYILFSEPPNIYTSRRHAATDPFSGHRTHCDAYKAITWAPRNQTPYLCQLVDASCEIINASFPVDHCQISTGDAPAHFKSPSEQFPPTVGVPSYRNV